MSARAHAYTWHCSCTWLAPVAEHLKDVAEHTAATAHRVLREVANEDRYQRVNNALIESLKAKVRNPATVFNAVRSNVHSVLACRTSLLPHTRAQAAKQAGVQDSQFSKQLAQHAKKVDTALAGAVGQQDTIQSSKHMAMASVVLSLFAAAISLRSKL